MNDPRDLRDPLRIRPRDPGQTGTAGSEEEAADAREREELRAVVSLLRSLPDPEPPEALTPRVLERVAARESRPALARAASRAARGLAEPRTGLALAAGAACLLVFAALGSGGGLPPSLLGGELFGGDTAPSRAARGGGSEAVAESSALPGRRSAPGSARPRRPSVVANPQFVSLFNSHPQSPTPRIRLERGAPQAGFGRFDRVDRGLDHQLNRLLLDPTAYCRRLERHPQREALIARLAERSAERGDAIEVALRVRQAEHPLGKQLADRLMHTAFVQRMAPR